MRYYGILSVDIEVKDVSFKEMEQLMETLCERISETCNKVASDRNSVTITEIGEV